MIRSRLRTSGKESLGVPWVSAVPCAHLLSSVSRLAETIHSLPPTESKTVRTAKELVLGRAGLAGGWQSRQKSQKSVTVDWLKRKTNVALGLFDLSQKNSQTQWALDSSEFLCRWAAGRPRGNKWTDNTQKQHLRGSLSQRPLNMTFILWMKLPTSSGNSRHVECHAEDFR